MTDMFLLKKFPFEWNPESSLVLKAGGWGFTFVFHWPYKGKTDIGSPKGKFISKVLKLGKR